VRAIANVVCDAKRGHPDLPLTDRVDVDRETPGAGTIRGVWYLRVVWSHDFVDEPVELFSEVGPDGYECRKVERFRDGRIGWADGENEVGGTGLGEMPIASIDEINEQDEFQAATISAEQFGRAWNQAVNTRS